MSLSGMKFRDAIGLVMTGERAEFHTQSSSLPVKTRAISAIVRDKSSPVPFAPMFKLVLCRGLIVPPSVRGSIKALDIIGRGRYRRHLNDIGFRMVRTGETLLISIRNGEAEHWGLTPLTVPGLCGDINKMLERRGQVATAIVPP